MFGDRRLIRTLKQVINELEEENDGLKYKLKESQHNNVILLESNSDLRKSIVDLENNLELAINNLSAQKRKQIGL